MTTPASPARRMTEKEWEDALWDVHSSDREAEIAACQALRAAPPSPDAEAVAAELDALVAACEPTRIGPEAIHYAGSVHPGKLVDIAARIRRLAPAAPGPEWVEVTDDPATWPPDDHNVYVLHRSHGHPMPSIDSAWSHHAPPMYPGSRWAHLPPWLAAAVAAARGTREGEGS